MKSASGNVLLYVLIGVVLFGALSFSLTKQLGTGGMSGTLTENQAKLKAESLINYATGAKAVIEQMHTMQNILPDEFDFIKFGDANYDDPPHRGKPYHPVGGGLTVYEVDEDVFASGTDKRGWVAQTGQNVEWTQTPTHDVVFTFLDLDTSVCKAINKRLYKDETIPVTTLVYSKTFIHGGGDDADFVKSECPDCDNKLAMCVTDANGVNAFYNILLAK